MTHAVAVLSGTAAYIDTRVFLFFDRLNDGGGGNGEGYGHRRLNLGIGEIY